MNIRIIMDVCFAICITLLLYQNTQLKNQVEEVNEEVNIKLGLVSDDIECSYRLIFGINTNGCADKFSAKFDDK